MKKKYIEIGGRRIGPGHPCYIVAEMSGNHNQNFNEAVKIIEAAKKAGADAVKLQTYKPETLTIDEKRAYFQVGRGTVWEGRNLYELYGEAQTPWEWQPKLKAIADNLKIDIFSAPFDASAVEFLEKVGMPAYKVASFEIVDLQLVRRIAETGKPVILSTGMATLSEIDEAVAVIRASGSEQLALLKCTSSYPARHEEMNLRTIPHLAQAFGVPVGLSDHTLDISVAVAAVVLGACIVEKHITLTRSKPGPDRAFSAEPQEFEAMVTAVRTVEKALGDVHYGVSEDEAHSRIFRRSLFVVEDMKAGEKFTAKNVRSIRPGHGLHTRYLEEIIGREATCDIKRGTPLKWDLVGGIPRDL